jgi:hypothetical protein
LKTQIFIEILILFSTVYLIFFKSYLTEKGRSAALKEDLDEVTLKVEAIKNEFTREQEFLRIELQRILSNEVSYRTEERDALIQFHGTISEWLFSILEVNYGNYGRSNIDALINIRNNIARYYSKAGIAKSKLELLVDDASLIEQSRKLYSATLAFHNWTDLEFLKLQHNLEQHKSLVEQFMNFFKDFDTNQDLLKSMATDENLLKQEAKDLFDHYIQNCNFEYFKVKPIEAEFTILVKKYLKK